MTYHAIEVVQGSDYEASFTVRDPDTSQPLDITAGYTVSGVIAKEGWGPPESQPLYTFPEGTSGLEKQVGRLIIHIPGSVSRNWTFERVVYGVKLVNNGSGDVVIGIRGPLHVIHTAE